MSSKAWRLQKAQSVPSLAAAKPLATTNGARDLMAYFEELLRLSGGQAPTKASFDPMRIAPHLDCVILYGFDEADEPVFRLIGEDAKRRIGHNPLGTRYGDYIHPERRDAALAAFRVCRRLPCAMFVDILQQFESGRLAHCEVTGIPLKENQGDAEAAYTLFLNCLTGEAPVYRSSPDALRFLSVRSRTFIDLGFGTPDDFEDRIMEEDETLRTNR